MDNEELNLPAPVEPEKRRVVESPALDDNDPDIKAALEPKKDHSKYNAVEAENPLELLRLINPLILNGEIKLYPWQEEILEFLGWKDFSIQLPLRLLVPAANGSGKDAYITAPFAIWHAWARVRSRCIITSSSFNQLQTQTEAYIRALALAVNEFAGYEVFLIKQFHIICKDTGSEIKMFSTDDPGRAEGYHPFPDYPKSEMAIVVNEAKTVRDIIFDSLNRCSGFNRWVEVSSPGQTNGHFYKAVTRSTAYPAPYEWGKWYSRKVTSYDCPIHISRSVIEDDKIELGETSPLFRSKHLAEFTSQDEAVVMGKEMVDKCLDAAVEYINIGLPRRAGLDLAMGGDENCFAVADNNYLVGLECFRATDAKITVDLLCNDLFPKYGFKKTDGFNIYTDHGGVGRVYQALFEERGWNLAWVVNQSRATNEQYGNRGAELWFRFARLIQEKIIRIKLGEVGQTLNLRTDYKLRDQLANRYYTQHKTIGKIILESKKEARAKGHGSPDRADAVVLAYTGVDVKEFLMKKGILAPPVAPRGNQAITQQKLLENFMEQKRYQPFEEQLKGKSSVPIRNVARRIRQELYGNI